jgi:hypothetical protein
MITHFHTKYENINGRIPLLVITPNQVLKKKENP